MNSNNIRKRVENMASTFIRFRVDEDLKIEASLICKKLGIDLQTYMRMCLCRLVSNKGIPFDMIFRSINIRL